MICMPSSPPVHQTATGAVPVETADPINAQILAVSEDRVQGFSSRPFEVIAQQSGVLLETVLERLRAMLAAGTIRRFDWTYPSHDPYYDAIPRAAAA